MHGKIDRFGGLLVDGFHYLALFAIGGAIVWSAVLAFIGMAGKGHASIEDILLLFIYLELGAMVGIYFKTNHMPVRFLIYVGITALTRKRRLLYVAWAFAGFGVLLGMAGFAGWGLHPAFLARLLG